MKTIRPRDGVEASRFYMKHHQVWRAFRFIDESGEETVVELLHFFQDCDPKLVTRTEPFFG